MRPIVNKIMYVGNCNKYYWHYQNLYKVLKGLCNKFIGFDYRVSHLEDGKSKMNQKFLETIEREKPDIIFFIIQRDEFFLETLLKIKKISPNSVTLNFFGDDDLYYESFSRYYSLFFDYSVIGQKQCMINYHKDGVKNVFFSSGVNIDNLKFMDLKKEYDLTFIGAPKSTRYEIIKFLIDNGIDVKIFGRGWEGYSDLSENYIGPITNEELIKIINKTKINLCFSRNSKNIPHFKGRIFEVGACNSFMLVENFEGYKELFKENKEIVMFSDKEDLLKKANYYLKNEKQRESIAKRLYTKIAKKYNFKSEMIEFLSKIKNKKIKHPEFPRINKKILEINKQDLILPLSKIKEKLIGFDYVCFNNQIINKDPLKEYFQVYSLEKSKKPISCSNCYITKRNLGNYLYFQSEIIFDNNKEDFSNLVNISQLAMTKEFFVNNIEKIRSAFNGRRIDFVTDSNITFILIPLLELSRIKYADYNKMKMYFNFRFLYTIYSLKHNKILFTSRYFYYFLLEILKGDFFLLWAIIDALKDKTYSGKLKELEE